jgi:CRP-like cAMP-binding protein
MVDRLAVLKKSELFAGLDDKELRIVEAMVQPKQVAPGTLICKQGKPEESIYVVEDGAVAIILEVGPMSQRQVQAACNYESFGWSALVEPYMCTASVKASEKTKLLAFSADNLKDLCKTRPDIGCKIYHNIARIVAKRLRQAYVQLVGVTIED